MNTDMSATRYDLVPYSRYTHYATRPDRLYMVGKLFGLKAPDYRKCRVLELACGSGDNLLAMASVYPKSEFIGIDLSKDQIETGRKLQEAAGLSNVTLKAMSILDVDKELGAFDYIIAHGVYSWVPAEVRAKILDICKENLSPRGVAYVSYNTLPGWNMIKSIRDAMRYHTESFSEPAQQIQQARLLLDFLAKGAPGKASPYKSLLEIEAETLKGKTDTYLFHEHLEADNQAFYFHEFARDAQAAGLQYLGDSDLTAMYAGNFSGEVLETLGEITEIVRQEQYMDFLKNRRFRMSLLCHDRVKLSRNLDEKRIREFHLTSNVRVQKEPEGDAVFPTFTDQTGRLTVTPHSQEMRALFVALAETGETPISYANLIKAAKAKLEGGSSQSVEATLIGQGLRLALSGIFTLHPPADERQDYTVKLSAAPKATALARQQAREGLAVVNRRHQGVTINEPLRILLSYLDGEHDREALAGEMVRHTLNGDLSAAIDGKNITDETLLTDAFTQGMEQHLQALADAALLVG